MKIKLLFVLIIFLGIIYWILNPSFVEHKVEDQQEVKIPQKEIDSTVTVSFSCVGDIMCHSTQYNYAYVTGDSFDFKPVFQYVKDYLTEKDILFGNLETVLAGDSKNYSGYPFFNTPNQFAKALKYAGFDFLFTANNHANDQGEEGVKRTIDILRKVNILQLGTDIPNDSIPSYNLFVRKGLRFGVLAYTYSTNYNQIALHPREYVHLIDTLKIKKDIQNLRTKKADLIIVYFHFGTQYSPNIDKYQKEITENTIKNGADIILASHPHIIQPFLRFKTHNGNLDSGFVTYSLGNFISNQRWRYSDGGLIFNFDITKNIFTDSIFISNASFLPIWVFKGKINGKKEYKILPSQEYDDAKLNFLTTADVDSMKRSYFDTIKLFTAKSNFAKIERLKDL